MELSVKLEVFEGPLDLLLHLLDKNKVSIYDIPIVEITDQYLAYIRQMQRQDLDIMSEFMVMAATLLDIKARWLLPKEENEDGEEEDPRAELVEQLLQYKMYKYLAAELKDREDYYARYSKRRRVPLYVYGAGAAGLLPAECPMTALLPALCRLLQVPVPYTIGE